MVVDALLRSQLVDPPRTALVGGALERAPTLANAAFGPYLRRKNANNSLRISLARLLGSKSRNYNDSESLKHWPARLFFVPRGRIGADPAAKASKPAKRAMCP